MKRFANLYLVLFLSDAALSVADELLSLSTGGHPLSFARTPTAFFVVILSLAMFLAMGLDRRLPKRLFLPLSLFALWGGAGFFPLAFPVAGKGLGISLSGLQLAMATGAFAWVKKRDGAPFALSSSRFSGPWFSLPNTICTSIVTLFLVPVFVFCALFASIPAMVEMASQGFMKIEAKGLVMVEKTYM